MPLHIDYRPKSLDHIYGNSSVVASVRSILERQDRPRAWLFTGPSGTGKTTMARIVATAMGCHELDYEERNIADARGIDDARKMMTTMAYMPQGRFDDKSYGAIRVIVLDECFAKNTAISTPCGQIPIDMITVGQTVHNLYGVGQVEKVFKNKVPLHRVARVSFSDGSVTFCSIDHQYMGGDGWKEAINLKKNFIFKMTSAIMNEGGIHYGRNTKMETKNSENLPFLSNPIYYQGPRQTNLLPLVFPEIPLQAGSRFIPRRENLRNLWQELYLHEKREQTYLREKLCGKTQERPTWIHGQIQDRRTCREVQGKLTQMEERESRFIPRANFKNFQANERRQSFVPSRSYREGQDHQSHQWLTSYMEGKARRKWPVDYASDSPCQVHWLGYGSGHIPWSEAAWIPDLLQGRYRQSDSQDSHRSGRKWAQRELNQVARLEEGSQIERIGVEGIEVYQPGNNDRHFLGVIGDREKNQGYVDFYDLQVSGHHSYFANSHLVHNCQAATRDFQQAILKSLEDTPAHVVFILCTTDPDKLLKTIRTRCTTFEMSLLPGPTMRDLVRDVLTAEAVSWPEETMAAVADAVTEMAEGSPRQALVALDQVIDLGSQEEMIEALRRTVLDTATVNELAKALLTRRKWEQVAKLIKGLPTSEDPEKVRRYIIAAAEGELLRTGSEQAAIVFDAFQKPFYDNAGKGLVFSAWRSLR
jgi:DNA polymerase III gamma/tau subunit